VVVTARKLGNRAGRVLEPGKDFLIVDDLAVEREFRQAGCRRLATSRTCRFSRRGTSDHPS
jgi:hypothetical protein